MASPFDNTVLQHFNVGDVCGAFPAAMDRNTLQGVASMTHTNTQEAQQAFHPKKLGVEEFYLGPKRRPPVPEELRPFLDVEHPPTEEGVVPDTRGCKDTTVAMGYYYSIKPRPTLKNPVQGLPDIASYQGPEFKADLKFSGPEFMAYLQAAEPVLNVQIQPHQKNHRYIRGGQSFKCRMKNCPDKRGTILKGQVRVAVTDLWDPAGQWLNPYQSVPGYVHLFCLEQAINLIEIVVDSPVSVLPDTRRLAHEYANPSRLSDHEVDAFETWVREVGCKWRQFQMHNRDLPREMWPKFEISKEDHLFYRMTTAHLEEKSKSKSVANTRKRKVAGIKGTAHLDEFVGDVSKQVLLKKRARAIQKGQDPDTLGLTLSSPPRASISPVLGTSSEPPRKRRCTSAQKQVADDSSRPSVALTAPLASPIVNGMMVDPGEYVPQVSCSLQPEFYELPPVQAPISPQNPANVVFWGGYNPGDLGDFTITQYEVDIADDPLGGGPSINLDQLLNWNQYHLVPAPSTDTQMQELESYTGESQFVDVDRKPVPDGSPKLPVSISPINTGALPGVGSKNRVRRSVSITRRPRGFSVTVMTRSRHSSVSKPARRSSARLRRPASV